jgi:hypothetical protein
VASAFGGDAADRAPVSRAPAEPSRSAPRAVPESGTTVPEDAAAMPAGSEPAALEAAGSRTVTAAAATAGPAADALSAMLAAAIPGTSFVDPLVGAVQPGPEGSDTSQDSDPSSANGTEVGGQSLT